MPLEGVDDTAVADGQHVACTTGVIDDVRRLAITRSRTRLSGPNWEARCQPRGCRGTRCRFRRGQPLVPPAALLESGVDDDRPDADAVGDDRRSVQCPFEVACKEGVERAGVTGSAAGLRSPELGQRRVLLTLPPPDGVPFRLSVPSEQEIQHAAMDRIDGV